MKKEGFYLIGGIISLNVAVIILFLLNRPWLDIDNFFVRLCSLLGIVALFFSAVLTPFLKELYQIFKKPFIKIHHASAIVGLIFITLHPVIFAIDIIIQSDFVSGLKVFLPVFTSAFDFWALAGRPALILIYIGLIGVLIRKGFKKGWRWLHGLNYLAFAFGVIHAILIGSDFYNFNEPIVAQELIMTIISLIMLIGVIVSFILKRVQLAKRNKKRPTPAINEEITETTTAPS
ncbi:MAG: hypothetical protein JXA54_12485 [Candidatus Heimdallarchaeota archaeon]|nr:hypothetical protein [Candidatus Heimdallarchaeota archaeon]